MAREKVFASPEVALGDVFSGAVVLVSGFAASGRPEGLLRALKESGVGDLTLVFTHGTGTDALGASDGVAELITNSQVSKLISPLPFSPGAGGVVEERWRGGLMDIEVVPQGILAERLRAGGAGLGGVFLPDAVGTRYADGKESRTFDGASTVLELPLKADYALIKAQAGDSLGNLVYDGTDRNWGPVIAMAATVAIAEVDQLYEPGGLDPEVVITPGIFVNRIVASK
ncbi:MAG: 3-oxoacid CoA-transferase subunit A [Dehalococcoidia bacterium]